MKVNELIDYLQKLTPEQKEYTVRIWDHYNDATKELRYIDLDIYEKDKELNIW